MKDKNINNIKIRKPHFFIYYIVAYFLKIFSKIFFRLKINKKEIKGIKGPFLVVANHSSLTDIVFTVSAFLPRRLNILTSKDVFTWKLFKPFIERVGCIPKSQFSIDIMALKMMKAAVEQGRNVVLYPEGKTSLDGKAQHYIAPSIGKLVKFLNVPVILSHTKGAYLTKPRYFKGFRYGKVSVTESILFTQEDIDKLSPKEIYQKVFEAIQFNDHIYQRENKIRFRSKNPALGMEYILYKCPNCKAEYKMRSTDRHLICDNCGNTVEYTEYGELIPKKGGKAFERVDLWYDYERKSVYEEIKKEDFYISKEVDFLVEKDRSYIKVGEGELYINKQEIGFKGERDGEKFEAKKSLKNLHTITTKNKEGIDLIFSETTYRFMFKNKEGATKYGLIVEQMYRLNHKLDEK